VEPCRRRRRGGRLHEHLRRQARLDLSPDQLSVLAANWLRWPQHGEDGAPTPEWPLEAVLDGVAAAGFAAIGLDHYTLGHRDPNRVASALRARGIACSDVGIVQIGELQRADLERLAEAGSALGATLCIAALYRALPHADVVRELRAAAAVLAPAGIRLAFEFTSYGNTISLAEAVAICDDVGWERCGLLVDAWHVFRGGESLADVAALDSGRIALVHVDDGAAEPLADGMVEGRFHRLLPGAGAFDLDGFFDALAAAGYAGPVSVEVLSEELRRLPPAEGARLLRFSSLSKRGRASRGTPPHLPRRRSSSA
jgi:sugar phosphate isomerase/epimerase